MNDRSYEPNFRGNPLSPMSPGTPGSDPYKANVNRTKTKKWVEARIQNYDGDDWGADEYDDDESDEPEPSRPTGLRQPGQVAGSPHQPPTPQSAGLPPANRSFTQPAGTATHNVSGNPGVRSSAGPPPLQLQTQPPAPLGSSRAGPAESESAVIPDRSSFGPSERGRPENVQSPPTAGGYPGSSQYSQSPGGPRHASPASRFPPRKSSIGQHDVAGEQGDLARPPRTSSRPGSSSSNSNFKPWVEQRSSSPGGPRPMNPGQQQGKPLPFVRPADIYRRMEEEKEKERRSMDSGRPSLDSIVGPGSDRSSSPGNAMKPPADFNAQRRRTSIERDDGIAESTRARSPLATVAERKSEYGMDRMLAGSQPGDISAQPLPASTAPNPLQASATSHHIPQDGADESITSGPDTPEKKRLSTSPRLPDLARMSGFGDDFFSGSSKVDFDENPTLPSIPDKETESDKAIPSRVLEQDAETATHQKISADAIGMDSTAESQRHDGSKVPERAPSMLEGPKLDSSPTIKQPTFSSSLPAVKDTSEAKTSSTLEPATLKKEVPRRPQLPGGWVSETPSNWSAEPTPMEKAEEPRPTPLAQVQTSVVSPIVEDSEDIGRDIEPTTSKRTLPSVNKDGQSDGAAKAKHATGIKDVGAAAGKHDGVVAEKALSTGPGYHISPKSLPPLKTGTSQAPGSATRGAPQEITPSRNLSESPPPPTPPKDAAFLPHSLKNPVSSKSPSEITPTLPLDTKAKKFGESPSEFARPVLRQATMSSVGTASPAKESDKLREEIMKSLTPVTPPVNDALDVRNNSKLTVDPQTGVTRESAYLSDVLDDYWGPEEKSLQQTGQSLKKESGHSRNEVDEGDESESPDMPDIKPIAPLSPHKTPEPQPQQQPQPPTQRERRFSWEAGPEEVTLSPVEPGPQATTFPSVKSKSPTEGPENTSTTATAQSGNVSQHNSPTEISYNTPGVLTPGTTERGGPAISHKVSQVSSVAPGGLGSESLEPPSPISVAADKSPTSPDGQRRLSLAEQKSLTQISSQAVAPSPPRGEHPALATETQSSQPVSPTRSPATPATPASPAVVPTDATPQPFKLLSFRDILNLPHPASRAEKFEETRNQFASMDSGLLNWIQHMQSDSAAHPDLGVNVAATRRQSGSMPSQTSPGSPPSQQPYYQQYLNASNPNLVHMSPPGRTSTGTVLNNSQNPSTSSGFAHGNQIGNKSKEMLHAAGAFGNKATKSGMKLFNKGKSKLKEKTGDKVFF